MEQIAIVCMFYNFKVITIIPNVQCNNTLGDGQIVHMQFVCKSLAFQFRGVKISVSNDKVRQVSAYTFYVDRYIDSNSVETAWSTQMVPSTANITITFPAQFVGVSHYLCTSVTVNDVSVKNFTCLKSGNQVIFRNVLTTSTAVKYAVVVISNVTNPSPGGDSGTFGATIGSDISIPDASNSIVYLNADQFTSCSANFNNAYGNKSSELIISARSIQAMNQSTYMLIIFPYFWSRDLAKQTLFFAPNQFCIASTNPGIDCSGTTDVFGYPTIQANHAFVAGSLSTSFSISSILSPPTNEPTNLIKIQSFDITGRPIDQCSTYPSGIVQQKISNIIVNPLQTPFPSTSIGLSISFNLPDILAPNDTIFLDFSSSYSSSYTYTNLTGSYTPIIISTNGATVNFTFNRLVSQGQMIVINTYNITTAPSIAPVSPFIINVQQYGYLRMTGTFTLPITIAAVTGITLTAQKLDVSSSSKYTLRFSNSGGVRSNGAVRVYFPNNYTLTSGMLVYCQGIPLTYTLISNNNGIQLSNFSMPSPSPTTITFQNISNLDTTSPFSSSISIKVYRSAQLMDQVGQGSSSFSITYQQISTLQAQVNTSSNITAQADIIIYMNISNVVPLPTYSLIKITYTNIVVGSDGSDDACFVNAVLQPCTISTGVDTGIVTINMAAGSVGKRSAFNISLQNIFINTYVTKPISTFAVHTYTSDGYGLEKMVLPVYVTNVNTPRPLNYFVLVSRTSRQNSAVSDYTLAVSQYQPLIATAANTLVLVFPSAIDLTAASSAECSIDSGNLNMQTATCSMGTQFLLITITNAINSMSAQPINNITATVYMDSIYKYSYSSKLDNSIANTIPSVLAISSTTYNTRIYGQLTNVTISTGSGRLSAVTNTINITLPKQYNIASTSCAGTGLTIVSCTVMQSILRITTSSISPSSTVSISLHNITAPKTSVQVPIIMTTYTANGYIIAETSLALWTPSCTLPCRTCTATTTDCLSCYTDTSISTSTLYDSANKRCRDLCLETQLQVGNTCVPCASTCYSCSVAASNCTKCNPGLYLYNYSCSSTCPSTYYKQLVSRLCVLCQAPCSTCVTSSQCLSCVSGWYYYSSQCIQSCPLGVTIPDNTNRVCTPCSIQCFTCSVVASNCTSCTPDLAMQNGRCVSQCTNNFYIYSGACVSTCKGLCVTCSIYATRCLSCPTNDYLYNSTCVTACPSMYYVSTDNLRCQYCGNLSIHCLYCSSISTCLICDDGYVLFQQQCLDYIPSGYANVTGVAQLCQDPCATCTNLVNNCTSCAYDYFHNGICIVQCPISHYEDTPNHLCRRCVSPCNTCLNQTACLSCLMSTNTYHIQAQLSCQPTCPTYFYANSSNYTCMPCIQPCVECLSPTSCLSCMSSTYLYNTRCLTVCPSGYYGNTTNNKCLVCQSPCFTCSGNSGTVCTSCVNGYFYLYPDQCVPTCPTGYIYDYQYSLCTNCTLPCLACSQTSCFKCNSSYILFEGRCVTACPSIYFVLVSDIDGTKQCVLCQPQCQTCTNATFCTQCAIGYFWTQTPATGICGNQCPRQRPILQPSGCQPCKAQNCTACLPNNKCTQCLNVSILFQGFCLSECPSGYIYNQSIQSCYIAPPEQKNQTLTPEELEKSKSVTLVLPVSMIFCIAGAGLSIIFIIISCCIKVPVWPLLSCAWALPETGVLGLSAYAYHLYYVNILKTDPIFGYIMIAGMFLLLLINIFVFFYSMHAVLFNDDRYRRWRKTATCSQVTFLTFAQTITLLNFKFQNFIWSQIKGTPKLQSTSKLKYMSMASAIGLLYTIGYTVSYIFLINLAKPLLLLWIDGLVVIIISALCTLLALRRDPNFFEEKVDNVILHRRHVSNDQFITAAMKGTYRQEDYGPLPDSKSVAESSYIDTSSQGSSRMQFRPSSRAFLSSRSYSQQIQSAQSTPKQSEKSKNINKQISLQCSILSSDNNANSKQQPQNSKYYIECDYEGGSKNGNMGSVQEEQEWDGVIHEHELYKQNYDLNNAVLIDVDGRKMENWDVESNEAVVEENIKYSKHSESYQNQSYQQDDNLLSQLEGQNNNNLSIKIEKMNNQESYIKNNNLSKQQPSFISQLLMPNTLKKDVQINDEENNDQINDADKTYAQKFTQILKQRLRQIQTSKQVKNSGLNISKSKILPSESLKQGLNISKNVSMSRISKNKEAIINKSILSNRVLNQSIMNNSINQQQQQYENEGFDRFDNSVVSNHEGSMEGSDHNQNEVVSQNSKHDGSVEELEQFNKQQQLQKEMKKRQQQLKIQEQKRIAEQIAKMKQLQQQKMANQIKEQHHDQQAEGQQERWQFLLQQSQIKNSQSKNDGYESQKTQKQMNDRSQHDMNDEDINQSMRSEQNSPTLQLIKNKSKVSNRSSVSKRNNQIIKQQSKQDESNLNNQRQEGNQNQNSSNQDNSEDDQQWEEGQPTEQDISNTISNQYLASKMRYRQPKPDDHNKFSIKTKRKKQNEPKTKVVVVNSRKFKKLRRQANQLERQIEQNERLKTLIASTSLGKNKKRNTSKDKEEQLKAIYMGNNVSFGNRYVTGDDNPKKQ